MKRAHKKPSKGAVGESLLRMSFRDDKFAKSARLDSTLLSVIKVAHKRGVSSKSPELAEYVGRLQLKTSKLAAGKILSKKAV